jgi:hypothetical protein
MLTLLAKWPKKVAFWSSDRLILLHEDAETEASRVHEEGAAQV